MNFDEYNQLKEHPQIKFLISVHQLKNLSDRTLLFGCTQNKDSWHVYLQDKLIHIFLYEMYHLTDHPATIRFKKNQIFDSRELVPDKRLYPECCDYEFCVLLKEQGIYLPFITWIKNRKLAQFYGEICE